MDTLTPQAALGLLFAIGVAIALGVSLDNISIGIGVGILFGAGYIMNRNEGRTTLELLERSAYE